MHTDFGSTVTSIVKKYQEFDESSVRDHSLSYTTNHHGNQITLKINKPLQKIFEDLGIERWFWKSTQHETLNSQEYHTYATLTFEHITLEMLSILESKLYFSGIKVFIQTQDLIHSNPIVLDSIEMNLKDITNYSIVKSGRVIKEITHLAHLELPKGEWISCEKVCKSTIGTTISIDEIETFLSLPDKTLIQYAKKLNHLTLASKQLLTPTKEFKFAVETILDKYEEMDLIKSRDKVLKSSVPYGGNAMTLMMNKKMQRTFDKKKIPLWKGCQYTFGDRTEIYSELKVKHCTLAELEYLENQLKEREIKVGLNLPYLMFFFQKPVKLDIKSKRSTTSFIKRKFKIHTCFHSFQFATLPLKTETEFEKLALKCDRVNTILPTS